MSYILNKRRTDKTRTKLTKTTLITPISIHTNKTKHQNKVQWTVYFFEAIVLKLILKLDDTVMPWLQACIK